MSGGLTSGLAAALLVLGAALVLVAAVGVLRLPDLFTRMHASTKPATLGASLAVAALALHFESLGIGIRALLVVFFFLLTAPVASHRLGRSAYRSGTPLWSGTVHDDLAAADAAEAAAAEAGSPDAPEA
jgi:multicomponent Na+:H+ antiporter subunit G